MEAAQHGVSGPVVRLTIQRGHVVAAYGTGEADLAPGLHRGPLVGAALVDERLDKRLPDRRARHGSARRRCEHPAGGSWPARRPPSWRWCPDRRSDRGSGCPTGSARSRASGVRKIRATPRSGDSGGSSGCRASLTPASSPPAAPRRGTTGSCPKARPHPERRGRVQRQGRHGRSWSPGPPRPGWSKRTGPAPA